MDTWNGKPLEECTREELIDAARRGKPSRVAARHRIVLDTLAEHTRRETAERLGLSYAAVCTIAHRAGIAKMARRRPARADVVAEARANGLSAAARVFGVTGERVRQIVVKHERATGEHIQRGRRDQAVHPRAWPQTVLCGECRHPTVIRSEPAFKGYSGFCQMCAGRRRGGRFDYAKIEAVIAERLAGGRSWHRIAIEDYGLVKNTAHMLPRTAFIQLRRAGRQEEIARLWPRGLPAYLMKREAA